MVTVLFFLIFRKIACTSYINPMLSGMACTKNMLTVSLVYQMYLLIGGSTSAQSTRRHTYLPFSLTFRKILSYNAIRIVNNTVIQMSIIITLMLTALEKRSQDTQGRKSQERSCRLLIDSLVVEHSQSHLCVHIFHKTILE